MLEFSTEEEEGDENNIELYASQSEVDFENDIDVEVNNVKANEDDNTDIFNVETINASSKKSPAVNPDWANIVMQSWSASTSPVGKYLSKVNKITLEQRSIERCSNVFY